MTRRKCDYRNLEKFHVGQLSVSRAELALANNFSRSPVLPINTGTFLVLLDAFPGAVRFAPRTGLREQGLPGRIDRAPD